MKSTINRLASGIGYGFLAGAAAGLTAGVLLGSLFPWTAAGALLGVGAGCITVSAAGRRSRRRR